MRYELLNREIYFTLREAKVLITRWKKEYNHVKPRNALGYHLPAPQTRLLATQLVGAIGITTQLVQSLGDGRIMDPS